MAKKTKELSSGKIWGGVVLIILGFIMLSDSLGFDISDHIAPIALIGVGVYLMVRRKNKDMKTSADKHAEFFSQTSKDFENTVNENYQKTNFNFDDKVDKMNQTAEKFAEKMDDLSDKFNKSKDDYKKQKSNFTEASHSNGKLKYERAFGDLFINCNGLNVENVEVSSAFGNIDMQMKEAIFTDNLNRLIISNFIGNVNIYIPKDIAVFVNCSNFIGDIIALNKRSTGFGNKVESFSPDYDSATRKFYIACSSFIGDINIISV